MASISCGILRCTRAKGAHLHSLRSFNDIFWDWCTNLHIIIIPSSDHDHFVLLDQLALSVDDEKHAEGFNQF